MTRPAPCTHRLHCAGRTCAVCAAGQAAAGRHAQHAHTKQNTRARKGGALGAEESKALHGRTACARHCLAPCSNVHVRGKTAMQPVPAPPQQKACLGRRRGPATTHKQQHPQDFAVVPNGAEHTHTHTHTAAAINTARGGVLPVASCRDAPASPAVSHR